MNPILKKLKLIDQSPVLILNAPDEYQDILSSVAGEIHQEIQGKYDYIQYFATTLADLTNSAKALTEAIKGDGYLWVCYPKGTSRKYKSDLNRNTLLEVFAPYNFEGVTQVAIDEDWSALRVKHVDYIKTMNRKSAFSEKGKERIKQ